MQSIRRLDLMREAISMQSEAKVGGASSHAIDSAAGPDEGGTQHAIREALSGSVEHLMRDAISMHSGRHSGYVI